MKGKYNMNTKGKIDFTKTDNIQFIEEVAREISKEDKLKKWYAADGYKLTSYEVRYNNMNGRFYIYARMYKQPQEGEKIDKATSKIKQKTAKKKTKKKTVARCGT